MEGITVKIVRYATALLVTGMFAVSTQAQQIDFEGLTNRAIQGFSQYNGFNWVNFDAKNLIAHQADNVGALAQGGYTNMATSGNTIIYNSSSQNAAITKTGGGVFDFTSANMGAAWNDGLQVTVTGWLNGSKLDTKTITLNTSNPTLVSFNFSGIDKLTFSSFGGTLHAGYTGSGNHFTMDDMTFSPVAAVPEPSTYAMMFVGLGLVGLMARRRKLV